MACLFGMLDAFEPGVVCVFWNGLISGLNVHLAEDNTALYQSLVWWFGCNGNHGLGKSGITNQLQFLDSNWGLAHPHNPEIWQNSYSVLSNLWFANSWITVLSESCQRSCISSSLKYIILSCLIKLISNRFRTDKCKINLKKTLPQHLGDGFWFR